MQTKVDIIMKECESRKSPSNIIEKIQNKQQKHLWESGRPNQLLINNNLAGNGLNSLHRRHRLDKQILKKDPYICNLNEIHQAKRFTQTESERLEKDIPC